MKININKAGFNDSEYRFLLLLQIDNELEKIVQYLRLICHIPPNGFSQRENYKKKNISNKTLLAEECLYLTKTYGLNKQHWLSTFINIVLFSTATPTKIVKENRSSRYQPIRVSYWDQKIEIEISQKTSFDNLFKYLGNLRQFKANIEALPTTPHSNMESMEQAIEIMLLKHDISYKEVGRLLEKKYGDKLTFSPDYDALAKKAKNLRDVLKNAIKNHTTTREKQIARLGRLSEEAV